MQIEAMSVGKRFDHPEANEDSFVVIAGAGYAVIDGVTDRNGTRYGGMLSGRFASHVIKRATERFLLAQWEPDASSALRYEGPEAFVEYLTASLHEAYVRLDVVDAVGQDWKIRAGCTVAAALQIGDRLELVAVGDSGIRINGSEMLHVLKPLDDVTGLLRREAWRFFESRGAAPVECDTLAAAITWPGTRHQRPGAVTADAGLIAEIERRALAACREQLPHVPESELLDLIWNGIAHGQGNFQNVEDKVLGYGGLDGFRVPHRFVESRAYPLDAIDTIELFTDGYFKPGEEFGVVSWEAAFREVEADDPRKLGPYLSTKGTTAEALTDDRTYLGVRLK